MVKSSFAIGNFSKILPVLEKFIPVYKKNYP